MKLTAINLSQYNILEPEPRIITYNFDNYIRDCIEDLRKKKYTQCHNIDQLNELKREMAKRGIAIKWFMLDQQHGIWRVYL